MDGDRDTDSSDAKAISTLRASWIGGGPLTITASVYRAEYDLDRDGDIDGDDALAVGLPVAAQALGQVSAAGASGPDGVVGYGGYVFNRESLLYTVRHRHYSPALGRWLERDPFGYVDGTGLYEYCRSNPVGFLDPTGPFWDDVREGVKELIHRRYGDRHADAAWLSAVERASANRRAAICELLRAGKITAERARALLAAEGALVDAASGAVAGTTDQVVASLEAMSLVTKIAAGIVLPGAITWARAKALGLTLTHFTTAARAAQFVSSGVIRASTVGNGLIRGGGVYVTVLPRSVVQGLPGGFLLIGKQSSRAVTGAVTIPASVNFWPTIWPFAFIVRGPIQLGI